MGNVPAYGVAVFGHDGRSSPPAEAPTGFEMGLYRIVALGAIDRPALASVIA